MIDRGILVLGTKGWKPHVKMAVVFLLYLSSSPPTDKVCLWKAFNERGRRCWWKLEFFFFIHAMIISHSPSEAKLNWSMMKICASRKICREESSVSIRRLKFILRIHDQFKLRAEGSSQRPTAPLKFYVTSKNFYWLKHLFSSYLSVSLRKRVTRWFSWKFT